MFTRLQDADGGGGGSGERTLTVKIESLLEGVRPEDTLFIFREAQFYPHWFPLMSEGRFVKDIHPFEGVLHSVVDTPLLLADLVLTGWACDDLQRSGCMLFCVRPAKPSDCPGTPLPPHPRETHGGRKIFPPTRAHAIIDVLFEPITATSVRFVFQVSLKLQPLPMIEKVVQYVLSKGMANIFANLKVIAQRMGRGDPTCPHVPHVASAAYAPTADYIRGKVNAFLERLSASNEEVDRDLRV